MYEAVYGVVLLVALPALVTSSGDGNIKLLGEEVDAAIKACTVPNREGDGGRQRRSENYGYDEQYGDASPRIDGNTKTDLNQYSHERRNTSDMKEQIHVLNATDYDYGGYGAGNQGEKFVNSAPKPAGGGSYNESTSVNRTRRNEPLLNKGDNDQCLSQCVFANLQVVDSRGIPREAELWNKVQSAVSSQQSRTALKDQIRACFQELQSEAEDNGCSYSNKLERCLMLRFSDRSKSEDAQAQATTEATQKT
ncbi:hypothetical protein O0L34_g7677 [Tuta absoluta]|nr:hypothetical protein O0L34_g7677 [Tuta absoluta]